MMLKLDMFTGDSDENDEDLIERTMWLRDIAAQLFYKKEWDLSPEEVLLQRENSNNKKLAELKGESYQEKTLAELKQELIGKFGEDGWNKIITNIKRHQLSEKWSWEKEFYY